MLPYSRDRISSGNHYPLIASPIGEDCARELPRNLILGFERERDFLPEASSHCSIFYILIIIARKDLKVVSMIL